jgi:C-terminal processing protease CtpA/Prc
MDNKKNKYRANRDYHFKIRMTKEERELLKNLAEKFNYSQTDILMIALEEFNSRHSNDMELGLKE